MSFGGSDSHLPRGTTKGSNPFATRFIHPGAREFLFLDGTSADLLVDRLEACGWKGQIVGPHGSGKSTLVATLIPRISQRGRRVFHHQLHDGQRRLEDDDRAAWNAQGVVVVDGYEQLAWWARWRLVRYCRRVGCGLLVTAHLPQRLPIIYQTQPGLALLERLVDQLIVGTPPLNRPTPEQVRDAFHANDGNLREALFHLYDVFERARGS